jgi:hypothetical protein
VTIKTENLMRNLMKDTSYKKLTNGFFTVLIFLSGIAAAQDNQLSEQEISQGWELLFNGKDMTKWRNFKKDNVNDKWQVNDGQMQLLEKGAGDILTKQRYQNFDLRLDWKISQSGNSGIFILADELGKHIYSHAPEIQILDNQRHSDNKLSTRLSGSLYDMIASPVDSQRVAGQWNQVRILLKSQALKVWQNNVLTVDIEVASDAWKTLVNNSKFKSWKGFGTNLSGHIGLQDHDDPVAFKNIKIRRL